MTFLQVLAVMGAILAFAAAFLAPVVLVVYALWDLHKEAEKLYQSTRNHHD